MNMASRSNRVRVLLRVRPSQKFPSQMICLNPDNRTVDIHLPKDEKRGVVNNQVLDWSFRLDGVMHGTSQEEVYQRVGADVVEAGLRGYNGTIMCYGQTGAGKTYTLTGATETFHNRGIVPRALSHLYHEIEDRKDLAVIVRLSYLEIYNEQLFDLLSTMPESQDLVSPMTVVEDDSGGVFVKGLSCHIAQTEEEALNLLFEGETNRTTATHALNARSSRSHCILTVYIESRSRLESDAKYTVSKLNFVDLAGSERLQKTGSKGKTLQEAAYINKSLSFLEQAVIALSDRNREHVPFRQSKLTHFLKDAVGGNCITTLVANVWGESSQIEETTSTLRFATRMMRVAIEPIENEQYDPTIMVKNLRREIDALKKELAMHDTLNNRSHVTYEALSEQQRYEIRQQVRKFVDGQVEEIDIINLRQIQGVFDAFRDMVRGAEREVEQRLRERYAAAGITLPTARPSAQGSGQEEEPGVAAFRPGAEEEDTNVGDLDGRGFGVGAAGKVGLEESGVFLQNRRKEARRRQQQQSAGKASGTPSAPGAESGSPFPDSASVQEQKQSAPPNRQEAFEEFKRDLGSEIYRILSENKSVLLNKRDEYSRLASRINAIKTEIDRSKLQLESLREIRLADGPSVSETGETIITEEEFNEINKLRDLKSSYKTDYEELKNLRGQLHYCQKMVDLTRQRFLDEFDKWYTESFVDSSGEILSSRDAGLGLRPGVVADQQTKFYEDPLERFDRVKHERFAVLPEAEPYNRAREELVHRHVHKATQNQHQPQRNPPGTPIVSSRHRLPTTLHIQS